MKKAVKFSTFLIVTIVLIAICIFLSVCLVNWMNGSVPRGAYDALLEEKNRLQNKSSSDSNVQSSDSNSSNVSPNDIALYNEILNELERFPDISEDDALAILAPQYNMTEEEIKEFMDTTMEGMYSNNSSENTIDFLTLISYAETAIEVDIY